MVDGGTRGVLRAEPGFPDAPPAFRRVLDELARSTSRDDDDAERQRGGRVVALPLRDLDLYAGGEVVAAVQVGGTRREVITLYIEDVVWMRFNVETGEVRLQLKARSLWASGYESVAGRWLDLVLWWATGRTCTLAEAHAEGWRMTGIELCSDFVGVDFRDDDLASFVGFKATEVVRKFSRDGRVETLNLGTRASPISLCIYDKDAQVVAAKRGDDSIYRATHLAHGWDGKSERRRVEFRLTGRGLQFQDDETGEVLDFRDPATLADRDALCRLWAVLCSKKRLVDLGSASRVERCKLDPRWSSVLAASSQTLQVGFRQSRVSQLDAYDEAARRARRDLLRSAKRFAALHDRPEEDPVTTTRTALHVATDDERAAIEDYGVRYRRQREAFMGEEIRTRGPMVAPVLALPLARPVDLEDEPPLAAALIERCTELAFARAEGAA